MGQRLWSPSPHRGAGEQPGGWKGPELSLQGRPQEVPEDREEAGSTKLSLWGGAAEDA